MISKDAPGGINLLRRSNSALIARELTFEGSEAAVVEWDEFNLEEPIQGSSLTLRIISEADREWVTLYTVNDGDIVAEVMLDGQLWWRGSLDPETYEEPYEKAKDYTVTLRFSDFGPLKRHQFTPPDNTSIMRAGKCIGSNLLAIGTISSIGTDGLPANAKVITENTINPSSNLVDPLLFSAGISAFYEEGYSKPYIKAWEGLSALLRAGGLRMVQRAGKIIVYTLDAIRKDTSTMSAECEWSGDSQTLGADAIASRVTVRNDGDNEPLFELLETARPEDTRYSSYRVSDSEPNGGWNNYTSFSLDIYSTSNWPTPDVRGYFFKLVPEIDNVGEEKGWIMACRLQSRTVPTIKAINATYNDLKGYNPISISPKGYLHLPRPSVTSADRDKYRLNIRQKMLFDARYNPFSGATSNNYTDDQSKLKNVQVILVLSRLKLTTESGKTYYCTNRTSTTSSSKSYRPEFRGTWQTSEDFFWLQYRKKDAFKKDNGIVNGQWISNQALIPLCRDKEDYKNSEFDKFTQALPDGEFIPLPPEPGWITLEVFPIVSIHGRDGGNFTDASRFRWILAQGAEIEVTERYRLPENGNTEVTVVCNNGAEDDVEITTLLGSAGGFGGCRTALLYDGQYTLKNERSIAADIASQLCMRRTKLSGEAYIVTDGSLKFCERLQGSRIFHLVSERMDLQKGWGDRVITELVRTDIDGLEVIENGKVTSRATEDRGGRDGKDAEMYSIVPTATAISISHTVKDEEGREMMVRWPIYVPPAVGGTVYLTRGEDKMKTRDGVLRCKITSVTGDIISDEVIETDGGVFEPVTVPQRAASIEFKLLASDTEKEEEEEAEIQEDVDTADEDEDSEDDDNVLAICTIPVPAADYYTPVVDELGDLNFVDMAGNKALDTPIKLNGDALAARINVTPSNITRRWNYLNGRVNLSSSYVEVTVETLMSETDKQVESAEEMKELKLTLTETKTDKEGNKTSVDITEEIGQDGIWKRRITSDIEQLTYTLSRALTVGGMAFKISKDVTFTDTDAIAIIDNNIKISGSHGELISNYDLVQLKGDKGDPGEKGEKGDEGKQGLDGRTPVYADFGSLLVDDLKVNASFKGEIKDRVIKVTPEIRVTKETREIRGNMRQRK